MIVPTPYQNALLAVPEDINIMAAGGRGGGKTSGAMLILLRHVELYGERARPLVARETYKALTELEDELDSLFTDVYGKGVKRNRADHMFRLPNGAVVELTQIDGPQSYKRHQGKSYTLLLIEELGLFREHKWIQMLVSNLRAPEGIPLRQVCTANPGGPLHAYVHHSFIARAVPWRPFTLNDEPWVVAPSTLSDNPHIDAESYKRKLATACGNDTELLAAWLSGSWAINRGAFWAGALDETVHRLPAEWKHPVSKQWSPFFSLDWGQAAPSVCFLCLRAPGDVGPYPKGSLILLDEVASYDPNEITAGLNWPPGVLAEAIHEMAKRWDVRSVHGVGDDARGLEESLLQVLRSHRVYLQRPRKERVAGWARCREMLHNAKARNGLPGLWISERCRFYWMTAPFIQRDELRKEDLDTRGNDHACDAKRYAALHVNNRVKSGRTIGHW